MAGQDWKAQKREREQAFAKIRLEHLYQPQMEEWYKEGQEEEKQREAARKAVPVNEGGAAGTVHQQHQSEESKKQQPPPGESLWAAAAGFKPEGFDSIKDPGFWIFLISLPVYFSGLFSSVIWTGLGSFFKGMFSTVLFLPLVVIFVQKGRGIFATTTFVIWYTLFGATFNTQTLLTICAMYLSAIAVFSALGKLKKLDTPLSGMIAEDIVSAIIPCVLFFADVGFVSWLIKNYNLTFFTGIESLLMWLPIWTLYGLWVTKRGTGIIEFLKVASAIYIVSVLTVGIVPNFPQLAGDVRAPALDDIQKAKQEVQAKLPGENPAFSAIVCAFTQPTNQQCAQDRQAESKCKTVCGSDKITTAAIGIAKRSKECEECLAQAKGLVPAVEVPGAIDPTQREPTVVTLREGEGFISSINPGDAIPISVEVKNPRAQELTVIVGCTVEQTVAGQTQSITGELSEIKIEAKEDKRSVRCKPLQLLSPGPAKVKVEALISGLVTSVWLERFFVGSHKDLEDEIKKKFFPTKESGQSKGPADYVRLDFEIGQPPSEPIVRTEDLQLWATLKNNGDGEIVKIHLARIGPFDGLDVLQTQGCNLQKIENFVTNPGFELAGKTKEKQIRYGLCDIQMDENLRSPQKPVLLSFLSEVVYDYKITRDFSLNVYQTGGTK